MVDTATAKYLNDNIGPTLAKGLAEMAMRQPTDGVEFLAQWLKTHAEQEEVKAWREKEEKVLEEERAKMRKAAEEQQAKRDRRQAEVDSIEKAKQDLLQKLNDPETVFCDSLWAELVEVAKRVSKAKAVYLGLFDEAGLDGLDGKTATGPCIRYDYTTPGSEWMIDKVLSKDTGVTYGALKESPPDEEFKAAHNWKPPLPPKTEEEEEAAAEANGEGEGDAPPAEDQNTMKNFPVLVNCVTDVDNVLYFDMTRLGAYLAVPLVFSSYHTTDALEDAKKFETEKAEEAKKRVEAADEAARLAAEAAEKGEVPPEGEEGAAPTEPEPVVEKEMVLRGVPVQYVLCMDTLGTNHKFDESNIMPLVELCQACGACKSNTERREVDMQALETLDLIGREEMTAEITAKREEYKAEVQEEWDGEKTAKLAELALEDEPKVEFEAMLSKKYDFIKARKAVLQYKEQLFELKNWVVVPDVVINAVAACAFLYGTEKKSVYPRRKSVLKWEKLKTVMDDTLFHIISNIDVAGERLNLAAEHKLTFVEKLLWPGEAQTEYDIEKMVELSPIFEVFLAFVTAATQYRRADVAWRKGQIEREMKAKQEAEEAYTGTPLEGTDDDFEV